MLGQLTTLPIKSLRVAKDSLTNTSRGYAFVELNSTSEAIQLYELLVSMAGNFYVDGRQGNKTFYHNVLIYLLQNIQKAIKLILCIEGT